MLTKNFKNLIMSKIGSKYADITLIDGTVSNVTYNTIDPVFKASNMYTAPKTSSSATYCLLGAGLTPETEADLDMEIPITTLTCSTFTVASTGFNNGVSADDKHQYVATFVNDTNADITVSEIGIYFNPESNKTTLMYHKTFNPITFTPGETKTFTITLS